MNKVCKVLIAVAVVTGCFQANAMWRQAWRRGTQAFRPYTKRFGQTQFGQSVKRGWKRVTSPFKRGPIYTRRIEGGLRPMAEAFHFGAKRGEQILRRTPINYGSFRGYRPGSTILSDLKNVKGFTFQSKSPFRRGVEKFFFGRDGMRRRLGNYNIDMMEQLKYAPKQQLKTPY